jgi:flagellar basal-body rod protein FlgC
MDYSNSFRISAAGMTLEKARVDVTALNLANMHTSRGPDGSLYRPLRVVAQPGGAFATTFEALQGPRSVQVEATSAAPRLVHEPGHPQADERGFVAYPGVDHASEMVTLLSALRGYEANVVAMNAAKTMALKALDIGGQG